jgi:hypothetical protein
MNNVTNGPATAADFGKWRRHAKTCCADTLRYIVEDCSAAARAMAGWNPERECFYLDQSMTYWDELQRR